MTQLIRVHDVIATLQRRDPNAFVHVEEDSHFARELARISVPPSAVDVRFEMDIEDELHKAFAKGYDAAHDDAHGREHLISLALTYIRDGRPLAAAGIITSLAAYLSRQATGWADRPDTIAAITAVQSLAQSVIDEHAGEDDAIASVHDEMAVAEAPIRWAQTHVCPLPDKPVRPRPLDVRPDEIAIRRPHVPYGPKGIPENEADADYMREAGRNIRHAIAQKRSLWGSNLSETIIRILGDCEDALRAHDAPLAGTFPEIAERDVTALAADEDIQRGPAAPVQAETYHGTPLVTPDVPLAEEPAGQLNEEAVERAARALFEPEGLPGEYSWAEMVVEDTNRAEMWRDHARQILSAAMLHTIPQDFRPDWMTADVVDRAYARELIARIEVGLTEWERAHDWSSTPEERAEQAEIVAGYIASIDPDLNAAPTIQANTEENGARRRYTLTAEVSSISIYHLWRALDAARTIEARSAQLIEQVVPNGTGRYVTDRIEGNPSGPEGTVPWSVHVRLSDEPTPEAGQ
jgi:hypothetical protein